MTNSLLIGSTITDLLTSNIKSLKDKVYPIVAEQGTTYPFVVYKRVSDLSNGCKDGFYEDTVNFEIAVVSTGYAEGINIAQKVRNILERKRIRTDLMELTETHITNAYEEFTDNVYVQKINFITKIN